MSTSLELLLAFDMSRIRKQIGDSANPKNGSSISDGMLPKIRLFILCTKGRQRGFLTWRNSSTRNRHQFEHCRSDFSSALSAPPRAVILQQPTAATRPTRTVVLIKGKLPSVAFQRILKFQSPREMASRLGSTTLYTRPRLLFDPGKLRLLADPESRPTGADPQKSSEILAKLGFTTLHTSPEVLPENRLLGPNPRPLKLVARFRPTTLNVDPENRSIGAGPR